MKVELDIQKSGTRAKDSMVLPIGGSLEDYAEYTRKYLDCDAVVVMFCESIPILCSEGAGSVVAEESTSDLVVASIARHRAMASLDPARLTDPVAASDLGFGFYAGFPLYLDTGERLGMLAALDTRPRALSGDQMATLKLLAAIIVQTVSFQIAVAGSPGLRAANG